MTDIRVSIDCVYVSANSYEKLIEIGLEELAYQVPLKRHNAFFSEGGNCWIDPELFKEMLPPPSEDG